MPRLKMSLEELDDLDPALGGFGTATSSLATYSGPNESRAIDGSKFRAVANGNSVRYRDTLRRYLDGMEQAHTEQQVAIDPYAAQAAIEKLSKHRESEVGFMRIAGGTSPGYKG